LVFWVRRVLKEKRKDIRCQATTADGSFSSRFKNTRGSLRLQGECERTWAKCIVLRPFTLSWKTRPVGGRQPKEVLTRAREMYIDFGSRRWTGNVPARGELVKGNLGKKGRSFSYHELATGRGRYNLEKAVVISPPRPGRPVGGRTFAGDRVRGLSDPKKEPP